MGLREKLRKHMCQLYLGIPKGKCEVYLGQRLSNIKRIITWDKDLSLKVDSYHSLTRVLDTFMVNTLVSNVKGSCHPQGVFQRWVCQLLDLV